MKSCHWYQPIPISWIYLDQHSFGKGLQSGALTALFKTLAFASYTGSSVPFGIAAASSAPIAANFSSSNALGLTSSLWVTIFSLCLLSISVAIVTKGYRAIREQMSRTQQSASKLQGYNNSYQGMVTEGAPSGNPFVTPLQNCDICMWR